jgi:hypothetical protein
MDQDQINALFNSQAAEGEWEIWEMFPEAHDSVVEKAVQVLSGWGIGRTFPLYKNALQKIIDDTKPAVQSRSHGVIASYLYAYARAFAKIRPSVSAKKVFIDLYMSVFD